MQELAFLIKSRPEKGGQRRNNQPTHDDRAHPMGKHEQHDRDARREKEEARTNQT